MAETTVIETTAETVCEDDFCHHDVPADNCRVKCAGCGHNCRHHNGGMCGQPGECPCRGFDTMNRSVPNFENLEPDEIPTYTVAAAIEWMKRPENDARIKSMVERAQQAEKTFVQAADREIGKVGRLLIDMGTSDDILEDFTASFLSSITGIGR